MLTPPTFTPMSATTNCCFKKFLRDRSLALCSTVGTLPRHIGRMKWCSKCHQVLPLSQFCKSAATAISGRYCRLCMSDYSRTYYQQHRTVHNHRRQVNQVRYRVRNQEKIRQYFEEHHCVDCGEGDPRVLEFDHVRGKKDRSISILVREGWASKRLMSEIAKCEVRCANCHRRKTVEELRWPHATGA